MQLQPKVIVLGVLALGVGTLTTVLLRHGTSQYEGDSVVASVPEGAPTDPGPAKAGAGSAGAPAPRPAKADVKDAAAPRPEPTSPPASTDVVDPRLASRMAAVRGALRGIPLDKLEGVDRSRVPALLAELEPVLEKDLAAHLARDVQRGQRALDADTESAFQRSAAFYDELPKLAGLVAVGRAKVRVSEVRGAARDAVTCASGQDGQIRQAVLTSPGAQWILEFGIDPSVGTIHTPPAPPVSRGTGRRPPFQGGTDPGNGQGQGNGNGGGNPQRGRRRRGGG